jgi:hypothetical protein
MVSFSSLARRLNRNKEYFVQLECGGAPGGAKDQDLTKQEESKNHTTTVTKHKSKQQLLNSR